jgi:hypothetical protein
MWPGLEEEYAKTSERDRMSPVIAVRCLGLMSGSAGCQISERRAMFVESLQPLRGAGRSATAEAIEALYQLRASRFLAELAQVIRGLGLGS